MSGTSRFYFTKNRFYYLWGELRAAQQELFQTAMLYSSPFKQNLRERWQLQAQLIAATRRVQALIIAIKATALSLRAQLPKSRNEHGAN